MKTLSIGVIGFILLGIYLVTYKRIDLYFKLFLFSTLGLGSYYNLKYRMGPLMLSDISLVLFMIPFIINEANIYKKKKCIEVNIFYIIFIFFYMLILGIVSNYKFEYIFRDIKLYLYFFIPAIYLLRIRNDKKNIKNILIFMCKIIILSIVLNLFTFFTYGISNISNGQILRSFGIGLGFGFMVNVSVLCCACREQIARKYNYLVYYIIQIVLITMCIISFTRNVWLQLIITYTIYYICIGIRYRNKLTYKKIVVTFISIFLFTGSIYATSKSESEFLKMSREKFIFMTDAFNDKEDTFAYRMNDISSTSYKYKNPRIIFGYGFGDTRRRYNSNSNEEDNGSENSFLYYSWKFGIINFLILIYFVIKRIYFLFKVDSKFNYAMSISLLILMVVTGMSGNLNKYYGMPLIALCLIIDFTKLNLSE